MRLLTLRAPQAETLWDEVLPIEAKELPDDLYIREWANKYKDEGLVVIGVHAPEFPFERSVDTVRGVTKNRGIHYPVVIDNNHAVWRAFNNMYWPALYLADTDGSIRYHHFGEDGYEESERTIQELLVEAGRWSDDTALVSVLGFGDEAPPDWRALKSPETYVGYERAESFASPGGAVLNERRGYTAPRDLRLNQWALAGEWTMERGRALCHTKLAERSPSASTRATFTS